jgi:hypothetical protein
MPEDVLSLAAENPAVAAELARVRPDDLAGRRVIIGVLAFGVVATVAYWMIWFGVDRDILASAHTESYYAFENSFPLADAWMAASGFAAILALLRRRASALLWCIAAGTSSIYLGLMDVLFDLQNGIYRSADTGAVTTEVAINVLTIALGPVVIGWAWRRRRELVKLDGF